MLSTTSQAQQTYQVLPTAAVPLVAATPPRPRTVGAGPQVLDVMPDVDVNPKMPPAAVVDVATLLAVNKQARK